MFVLILNILFTGISVAAEDIKHCDVLILILYKYYY